jgi:hypothetical protein
MNETWFELRTYPLIPCSYRLLLHRTPLTIRQAFSDANWVGCPDGRRSTWAYCIFLGSNLISLSSRKQPTISRSSTEAKYKVVANTIAELLWIQTLLRELGIPLSFPAKLWCDVCKSYITCTHKACENRLPLCTR